MEWFKLKWALENKSDECIYMHGAVTADLMVNDDFCSSARPTGQLLDRFQVLRLNSLI